MAEQEASLSSSKIESQTNEESVIDPLTKEIDNEPVEIKQTSINEKKSSKKREIQTKTPLKEQKTNEVIQRLNSKSPMTMVASKEMMENLKSVCKSSLKKKSEIDEKENKPQEIIEISEKVEKKDKTPIKLLEEKKSQELIVSNNKAIKSIGKVSVFYQKCGLCEKNMNLNKEKTKLLSCTHRFHEDCIAGKTNKCFICDSRSAYDPRPSEKSLKKLPIN